jgi:hypothetical protein
MSADNWTQCPKCFVSNREKADTAENLAALAYGRIPVEEYLKKRDETASFRKAISSDDEFTSTLREDYEIGIYSGSFHVNYRAGCSTCGFSFEYKREGKL